MLASQHKLIPNPRQSLDSSRNNWSQRWRTHQRITRMICSCRYPWRAGMTPSTWELSTWAPQWVNQHASSSILARNTWPSPVHSAMIRLLATSSSKSTTRSQARSCRGISWPRGAEPRHTTCTNQTRTRSYQRLLPNLPMAQQSCRVSSGRTMHASSLWKWTPRAWWRSSFDWKKTSAPTFSSWLCTNHKVLDRSQMAS